MDNKVSALWLDKEIKRTVEEVWARVFDISNVILVHAKKYGFQEMLVVPNPNIKQLLIPVRALDQLFDTLLANEELEYSEQRLIFNAKQQLLLMERVAAALVADNIDDFNSAISSIKEQAQI